jgi:hypothetical protein
VREKFIRAKYEQHVLVQRQPEMTPAVRSGGWYTRARGVDIDAWVQAAIMAVAANNPALVLQHIACGGHLGDTQSSLLHAAAEAGADLTLTLLLLNGSDVNGRDAAGLTPLMKAATAGHRPCIASLLNFKVCLLAAVVVAVMLTGNHRRMRLHGTRRGMWQQTMRAPPSAPVLSMCWSWPPRPSATACRARASSRCHRHSPHCLHCRLCRRSAHSRSHSHSSAWVPHLLLRLQAQRR